ncbi:MAG: sel1 repeat family protein, partial [Pseudomonadota bacterium]|nr:sel1 repeat family protein [Pseudomonadota bacterium]
LHLAANQGHPQAQFNLGVSYGNGQGVTQNYQEAVKWFRMAAKQGNATAQNSLGFSYDLGQGVRQDYVRAHMWFALAIVNGHSEAQANRDKAAEHMTPAQIAEARKLARDCKKSNYTNCD